MTEDQIIDKVLKLMEAFPHTDYYSIYEDATKLDTNKQEVASSAMKLATILIHYDLIEGESPYYTLSGKGIVENKMEGG